MLEWEVREEERETKEGMWGEAAEIKGREKDSCHLRRISDAQAMKKALTMGRLPRPHY